MLDYLVINFRNLSHADFIIKVGSIADHLSAHHGFESAWPEDVPSPTELKENVANFTGAVNAAANGDRHRIQERDAMRTDLEIDVAMTGQHVVMRSIRRKDPSLLQNTGFDLKKRTTNKTVSYALVDAPAKFSVKHGPMSGTLTARANRVAGAATYELQACESDPTNEDSWKTLDQYVHCSRIEVKGLEPGKKFLFRIRGFGVNGHGPWSSSVSIMVI